MCLISVLRNYLHVDTATIIQLIYYTAYWIKTFSYGTTWECSRLILFIYSVHQPAMA